MHVFIFLCTNKVVRVQNLHWTFSRMSRSLPLLVFILLSYAIAILFLRCFVYIIRTDLKKIRTFFLNVSKYNQNRYIFIVSARSQNLKIIIIILIFMHSFYITICLTVFFIYVYYLIKRIKAALIIIRGILVYIWELLRALAYWVVH